MFPAKRLMSELVARGGPLIAPRILSRLLPSVIVQSRGKKSDVKDPNSLFHPIPVQPTSDDINVGAQITGGSLKKSDLQRILSSFFQRKEITDLSRDYGLDHDLQQQAFNNFRKYCLATDTLPVDLHVVISDILQGAGHVTDIFPYFIRHAKEIFPHLECMDDLKKISDLRTPANWYPLARSITRKIIFHAGPTNSGKTYHALERFRTAKSGLYCGPLKLLATEVFRKTNDLGTPCDLVTGEERLYARGEAQPAEHVSCTVEMARISLPCEVAVIDEIQLLKDYGRGWAWTRALLGIPANEIHLCGEAGAIPLVQALCTTTGEDVEIRRYKRLTELQIENDAVRNLKNIQPGDCIVCFSKNDIYTVSRELEALGIEVAVIYGGLPPNTKLGQAAKFNDANHSCKVMVATDAIGMGLNLHIRRVIFYSMIKPTVNEKGEKEMDKISVSSALQIAGRAGRYGTQWDKGFVTTFKPEDLPLLKSILSQTPEPIVQAGLHPTADQIELYAYHLPKAALSNLMDIFVSLCTVDDSLYFMCKVDDFKFLADMIQHVPLPLRARYVFCCAPINNKVPFPCTMFLKFARQYSKNEPITFNWLCQQIGWPFQPPQRIIDLVHLEAVFDVLDLYLWLSYRFMDLFPDTNIVRDVQKELDAIIQEGIVQLTKLLRNSETGVSSGAASVVDEDNFAITTQKNKYYRESGEGIGRGKLTERLLSQGLLTPSMLQELQKEWTEQGQKGKPIVKKIGKGRKWK
ncbi:ATP-dependent RNA helicase SUV3 homolog, mitochondrial [Diachasmimorpha longicaudata]|uniref:ATP-dependent RNA helicase SUV3 homolog, mitochondrial n=1 Tax=Diachasmimorpha longicaudata TaxID=58733 RepID=UPI0030B8B9A1